MDAEAAAALFKKENCTKCHAPDKNKKGASLKNIAKDNAGKADAVGLLVKHMTTNPKVKMSDGAEEEHKPLKNSDAAAAKNLAEWILSHK
jgi:cytochrome c